MTPSGKIGQEGSDDSGLVGPDAPGPDYQVFEVTDLLIPSGTDWSAAPHIIGTLEVERAVAVHWALAVTTDRDLDPESGVNLGFVAAYHRPLSDDSYFARVDLTLGTPAGATTDVFVSPFSPGFDGAERRTFDIGLWTTGAMPDDITVAIARAAFLII